MFNFHFVPAAEPAFTPILAYHHLLQQEGRRQGEGERIFKQIIQQESCPLPAILLVRSQPPILEKYSSSSIHAGDIVR